MLINQWLCFVHAKRMLHLSRMFFYAVILTKLLVDQWSFVAFKVKKPI